MVGAKMKYRISYQKNEPLIFISQLDMQKTFQRMFRRANVPLAYSEGFSPHPKMTYSPPLSLCVSSADEYIDVELKDYINEDRFYDLLKNAVPDALPINWVKALKPHDPSLSDLLTYAVYDITLESAEPIDNIDKIIVDYIESSETIITKKKNKKKQMVDKDIRRQIEHVMANIVDNRLVITAILSIKNDTLLNPNLFLQALNENVSELCTYKKVSIRKIKTM